MVLGLMNVDAARRMTASEALTHPWMADVGDAPTFEEGPMLSLRRIDLLFAREVSTSSIDEGGNTANASATFSGEQTELWLRSPERSAFHLAFSPPEF
jgi:hypothetical protein